ncbi:MAG TPA: hypothetical protein VFH08_21000 [Chitinophagaceae bacterium]|nr:hypothetical protein [Chitinophagaceae bacterium]
MKSKSFISTAIMFTMLSFFSEVYSQAYRFKIVNLITANQNDETNNDTEPNIAVNPANPNIIAASAFTFSLNRFRPDGTLLCDTFPCPDIISSTTFKHRPLPACKAPIYFSTDGGETWILKDVLPSNNGITHDISLAFSESGHLYVSILKGCQFGRIDLGNANNNLKGFMIFKSEVPLNDIAAIESLNSLVKINDFSGRKWDMPWVIAKSIASPGNTSRTDPAVRTDHVFVGVNNFANAKSQNMGNPAMEGQSATVLVCNNGITAVSNRNNFTPVLLETQPQFDKNPAGIRLAAHYSGKVYAIFYRVKSRLTSPLLAEQCDVILVRDDDFGRSQFRNLTTTGMAESAIAGAVIADSITLPLHYLSGPQFGFLDGNRITGSDLAIAVDPDNSNHVFAAWCSLDRNVADGTDAYTLHFRHNTNSGTGMWLSISEPLDNIKNAFNPAIAITNDRRVGFLYQQLTDDSLWETHFVIAQMRVEQANRNAAERNFNPIRDTVLSRFHRNEFAAIQSTSRRHLSDYLDLQAVGNTFYGVFAAINTPDSSGNANIRNPRFPTERPRYQRDQRRLLRNRSGERAVINPSIDPFFFRVDPIRRE